MRRPVHLALGLRPADLLDACVHHLPFSACRGLGGDFPLALLVGEPVAEAPGHWEDGKCRFGVGLRLRLTRSARHAGWPVGGKRNNSIAWLTVVVPSSSLTSPFTPLLDSWRGVVDAPVSWYGAKGVRSRAPSLPSSGRSPEPSAVDCAVTTRFRPISASWLWHASCHSWTASAGSRSSRWSGRRGNRWEQCSPTTLTRGGNVPCHRTKEPRERRSKRKLKSSNSLLRRFNEY